MIHIQVNTRDAILLETETITSGSAGIEVKFDFSEDWDGLEKVAVFDGNEKLDVYLTESTCVIPHEVIANSGGVLKIGVYGADGTGNIVIPTLWAYVGLIREGAMPSGTEPPGPTPSIFEQILAAAQAAEQAAESVTFDIDIDGILSVRGGNT